MPQLEKKLTVKQAINTLGLGRTTIYSWIKEGKLRSESTPRGKIILLTPDEEQRIKEVTAIYSNEDNSEQYEFEPDNSDYSEDVQEGSIVHSDPVRDSSVYYGNVQQQESEVMLEMLRTFNNLNDKLLEYSEQAGQVKLLTDSETRTKEEYFKIIQENAVLKTRIEQLTKENRELKEKLENKKKWFNFKIV